MTFKKGQLVIGTSYHDSNSTSGLLRMYDRSSTSYSLDIPYRLICRFQRFTPSKNEYLAAYVRDAKDQKEYKHSATPGDSLRFPIGELALYVELSDDAREVFGEIIDEV